MNWIKYLSIKVRIILELNTEVEPELLEILKTVIWLKLLFVDWSDVYEIVFIHKVDTSYTKLDVIGMKSNIGT